MGYFSVMLRTVNVSRFKNAVKSHGGYTKAAEDLDVSRTLLVLIGTGKYPRQVKETTRAKICSGFEINEDELFPFVGANEEKAS